MKKLIGIILAAIMIFTASACASKSGSDGEKLYIPVMAKGTGLQFWQVVKKGAEDAAEELGVDINFDGPVSDSEIDVQVNMIKKELAKNPKAMALAALSTEAVSEVLEECAEKNIPVIGFDSGVPDDKTGAVKATACTDNEKAAAIAAEKLAENADLSAKMQAATPDSPIVIACLSQDDVSASVTERTTGFVNRMAELAEAVKPGMVSVEGHDKWAKKADNAAVIIRVEIPATPRSADIQTAAKALLSLDNLVALFCSNEGTASGLLSAASDGKDLADGGKYEDLIVAGFDSGKAQKDAVRNGLFYGSVTQDPYHIGYYAVEMAVKVANGEKVSDVDTGAKWYDSQNIDADDIAMLIYD